MEAIFNELYKKYHHQLFNFLFYMVQSKEQAEDLVQEVYIRVLKSYQHFKGESSEKTWLIAIARNVAIDFFRKQKGINQRLIKKVEMIHLPIKDESPLPEEIVFQSEEKRLMYRCLEKCTIDQRSVIILRYIQELSILETAEVLGWKESKVKTTQHRAIKQLRTLMDEILLREKAS
ncbi:RNA polymerase sigma factor SigX [Neobacillus niacini]|jgi:RNA polymerase sigma-70 factor, ECF subfamily|uniref:RNA polymerase sigma factor SigX n=1 Tax=Neobacillus niacini TaxID=86668 RepID=UPI001C8EBE5B|nr:RNA polymerase sigma factor SigX [Neobacillus niacini]MBY0147259.1 RNA polymerase sigma factor SigX [Neobacillus niacini]